jgi:hypothetical protein
MSRNLRLWSPTQDLVLGVHPPSVSRRRLLAVQAVRQRVADAGMAVAVALPVAGSTVTPCGNAWAELEHFVPHHELVDSWDSYPWLFDAMGALHRTLAPITDDVPRPGLSFFAAPATLQRWRCAQRRPFETGPIYWTQPISSEALLASCDRNGRR